MALYASARVQKSSIEWQSMSYYKRLIDGLLIFLPLQDK